MRCSDSQSSEPTVDPSYRPMLLHVVIVECGDVLAISDILEDIAGVQLSSSPRLSTDSSPFPLMKTSTFHSHKPLRRAVTAETVKTSGPVCLSGPGAPRSFPTQDLTDACPRESSRSLGRCLLARCCPFWFVQQRRIRAVASPAMLVPEPGLPTRSLDGRTDFVARFPVLPAVGLVWKSCVFSDLEDFDFLHFECGATRENGHPVQSSVVGVSRAKLRPTPAVCVAVVGNSNATKVWTPLVIRIDCPPLLVGLRCKSLPRDVVRILQGGRETPQTATDFHAIVLVPGLPIPCARLLHQWREAAENVPLRINNYSQSVHVAVGAAVKVATAETLAGSPLQKRKPLPSELGEVCRKVRNDSQTEWARPWRKRSWQWHQLSEGK
jgi:hypothetical protein